MAATAQVTSVDVYLACHSADAGHNELLHRFCDRRIPRSVRDLTPAEVRAWKDSTPSQATILDAATHVRSAPDAIQHVLNGLGRVNFHTDSATLIESEKQNVLRVAEVMSANRDIIVGLVGLASATGLGKDNKDLASRRMQYVRSLLLENKVSPEQIRDTTSEGDSRSKAIVGGARANPDTTFQRVEIRIAEAPFIGTPASSAASVAGGGLTTAALLNGLTDYLIAEALREAESDAMKHSLGQLCRNSRFKDYIENSCDIFSEAHMDAYLPSTARLRAAVRADLTRMPVTLASTAMASGPKTTLKCVLRLSADMYVAMSEGQDPTSSLKDAIEAIIPDCDSVSGSALSKAKAYVQVLDEALIDLPAARPLGNIDRDSVVTYVVKGMAVNTTPAQRDTVVSKVSRLIAGFSQAQSQWLTIAEEIRVARADSAKGGNAARLSALISAGYPAFNEVLAFSGDPKTKLYREVGDDVRRAVTSLATAQYGEALGTLAMAARKAGVTDSTVLPVGTLAFAADLAQASSAEEVSAAFKRYAGSTNRVAQKRNGGARYIMINGYGGFAAGGEFASGQRAGVSSLYFPVGVERGWRVGSAFDSTRKSPTFGILFQLIDLGSLAAVRIGGSDSVDRTPPATFATVWAPGALFRFGVGNSPFVAGFGAEYVPVARREKETGSLKAGTRFMATLAVDIPLFGFK